MAVKHGYKQTEVGVIPEDWDLKKIGSIAEVSAGGTPSRNVPEYWNGGIPWVTTTEVDFRRIKATSQHISALGLKSSAAKLLNPGTILLALYGQGKTRGKVAILDVNATSNQACAAIVLSETVSRRFIFSYLASRYDFIRGLSNTGNQENLNGAIVKSIPVPLPPTLAEQEAIAGALSDADAWIESLEQLIAKKRQIKQGAMQELLTGKRRLPGFSGKWETKRLGDLGIFLKGSGVRKHEASSGEIPCVRYGEIYTHHNDYIRRFNSSISRVVAETATRLNYGDLLFAGSGETKAEIGKCVAYAHKLEAYAGGDIVILRSTNIDPVFMGYYCNTRQIAEQKAARGQGDAVVHISSSALASVQICIPEIHEQTAIASVLSDMDTEIEALESKLAKAREIKQGMMQELLTGRIRLV